MLLVNIILMICLLFALSKWFMYYCATRGLMYYLANRYSDFIDTKKAKELINMAVERTIKEFFGKC